MYIGRYTKEIDRQFDVLYYLGLTLHQSGFQLDVFHNVFANKRNIGYTYYQDFWIAFFSTNDEGSSSKAATTMTIVDQVDVKNVAWTGQIPD